MAKLHSEIIFFVLLQGILVFVEIAVRAEEGIVYDPKIVPAHCMPVPPVKSDYKPTGFTWKLNDHLTIYETVKTDTNPRRILIDMYDIFGYTENTKQVADILASSGDFRIVIPDYFYGEPFKYDGSKPWNHTALIHFIQEHGSWDKSVKADTLNVIEHFRKTDNVTEFGIFGFCWGGVMVVRAASELKEIKVAALIHPFSFLTDEANGIMAPMYLMPSKGEPDMIPFYNILQTKYGENCGHKRFNLHHGFASSRGNFSDPITVQAVGDVINTIIKFFNSNLV